MFKNLTFIVCVLILPIVGFGDTFTHRINGDSFNGYIVSKKKGNLTQVRIENRSPRYLNLNNYRIERNYLGRKNRVYTFEIKDEIKLIAETEAFEKSIKVAANQGPLFILIEIDTPGGQMELAKRTCSALIELNNCTTVAFLSGGDFGGAFSAGAIIALACDEIYMLEGTAIGAASIYVQTRSGPEDLKDIYGENIAEKFNSAWSAYCASIAELNNRPGQLVRAMVDKEIEVIEVMEEGQRVFIDPADKPKEQETIRTWSNKKSLLTLTAGEAVVTGIADGKVSSSDRLFKHLGAQKALKRPDRKMLLAKREFTKAKARFDVILNSIEYLEGRANVLVEQYNSLMAELGKSDIIKYREVRRDRVSGYYSSSYSEYEIERQRVFRNQDVLLNELLDALDRLIIEYRAAITMANRHADLQRYLKKLQKNLAAAQATYNDIR